MDIISLLAGKEIFDISEIKNHPLRNGFEKGNICQCNLFMQPEQVLRGGNHSRGYLQFQSYHHLSGTCAILRYTHPYYGH